ncbi:MAG: hypothetical protein AB7U20_17595 [Planctomycetaceae bacterium]
MIRKRIFRPTFVRTLVRLTVLVAVSLGASTADAVWILRNDEGDGHYSLLYFDDEGDLKSVHYYGPNDEYWKSEYFDSDPNPEGDGSGGTVDRDAIDAALDLLKKYGGAVIYEADPWDNPFGQSYTSQGKGPAVIDPAPELGALTEGEFGGGGGGALDPNVPIGEQIGMKKQQGRSSSDDSDGDDGKNEPFSGNPDPTLIDPPPHFVLASEVDKMGNGWMLLEDSSEGTIVAAAVWYGILVEW